MKPGLPTEVSADAKSGMHTDFKVILGILACFVVPFTLTLIHVDQPRPPVDPASNPTPLGYTWSLTLFLVPCVVLLSWFLRQRTPVLQKRAFWWTAGLMACLGMALDIFFGLSFFTFHNPDAVLGIRFYGYAPGKGWVAEIPIEEAGFYFLGCLGILLVYVWGDEYWFGAYNRDDDPRWKYRRYRELVSFHPWSVVYGVLLFGVGWWYKKYGDHPYHEGFPGYWLFMVSVAVTPSILFYPMAKAFVNWRAFSLALVATLFVSLFWEAAVAFPYQWWGYNPKQMMGLFITGFSGLPIEAAILWILAGWAVVIAYETLLTVLHLRAGASGRQAEAETKNH